MAKIAAAKAREEREERRRAKEDKTKKDDIDDTKENVMEDLLSALQSSGPATVSYSYMLISFPQRKGKTNQRNQILRITSSEIPNLSLVLSIVSFRYIFMVLSYISTASTTLRNIIKYWLGSHFIIYQINERFIIYRSFGMFANRSVLQIHLQKLIACMRNI